MSRLEVRGATAKSGWGKGRKHLKCRKARNSLIMSQGWQPSPTASSFESLTWGMLLWKKPFEIGQCFKNASFFHAQFPTSVSTFWVVLSASPLRLAPGTAAFIRRPCYFQWRPAAMTTRYPACATKSRAEDWMDWLCLPAFWPPMVKLRSSWSNHQISCQNIWVPDSDRPKPLEPSHVTPPTLLA